MRYMKDIIIDSRHLTTKVNLYLIIFFQNISIVYYIILTNQWCMLLVISLMEKKSYRKMGINEVRSEWVLLVIELIITFA